MSPSQWRRRERSPGMRRAAQVFALWGLRPTTRRTCPGGVCRGKGGGPGLAALRGSAQSVARRSSNMMRMRFWLAVWALLAVAGGRASAAQEAPARWALLIGVGEYPELARLLPDVYESQIRLRGPANDVALLGEVLGRHAGFAPERIRRLVSGAEDPRQEPTRERILEELARLADDVAEGDLALVYFAGHGTRQPMRRADPLYESDGLDEVLLAADARSFDAARGAIPGGIVDDELGLALGRIRDKGASVWFVADSCHSAGLLRGGSAPEGMRLRAIEPSLIGVHARAASRPGRSPLPLADFRNIVSFHAAREDGRAPELAVDIAPGEQRHHGLMTWLLARELATAPTGLSYRELMARIVVAYQAWPCRITVPGAEGQVELEFLGGRVGAERWLAAVDSEGALELDRGSVAGLVVGSRVELLSADSLVPIATAEVLDVGLFRAALGVDSGELPEGAGVYPVRLLSQPAPDTRLTYAIVDADGIPHDDTAARRVFDPDPDFAARFPRVSPTAADVWLVEQHDRWRLVPRGLERALDLPLGPASALPKALERFGRGRNLVQLVAGPLAGPLPEGLTLRVEARRGPRGAPFEIRPGAQLSPGAEVRVTLERHAPGPFDVFAFFVDAHFGIETLFPRGRGARLEAEAGPADALVLLDWTTLIDTSLGPEHVLLLARSVSPTDPVLDLSRLAQPGAGALRSGGDPSGLGEQIAALLRGAPTRSVSLPVGSSLALGAELVSFELAWPPLARPTWPAGTSATDAAPAGVELAPWDGPAGFPNPYALGARCAFAAGPGGVRDVLLSGSDAVDLIWFDFQGRPTPKTEPEVAPRERTFRPSLAVQWTDGERLAWYAPRSGGPFDRLLVDRNGDGWAEEHWSRGTEGWLLEAPVTLPWLSQAWAGGDASLEDQIRVARRLALLCPQR